MQHVRLSAGLHVSVSQRYESVAAPGDERYAMLTVVVMRTLADSRISPISGDMACGKTVFQKMIGKRLGQQVPRAPVLRGYPKNRSLQYALLWPARAGDTTHRLLWH